MKIDAKTFKEHIASDDFRNSNPKYPEKKKKLKELAERLTDFDNPVLMFVTFKTNFEINHEGNINKVDTRYYILLLYGYPDKRTIGIIDTKKGVRKGRRPGVRREA